MDAGQPCLVVSTLSGTLPTTALRYHAFAFAVALLLAPGAICSGNDHRRLGEQAAAAADANIMANGGRTAGFAPSDRAPITNFGGSTSFTNAGVGFNGGTTTSFDNFRNPVTNQGGRGQIF
jgi:hypothetical protein